MKRVGGTPRADRVPVAEMTAEIVPEAVWLAKVASVRSERATS